MTTLKRFLLVLASFMLIACSDSSSPQSQAAQQAPSQSDGSTPRIAALSPAMAVMLQRLGHEDLIVAKHDYDLALSSSIPHAGSELSWDLEQLIVVDPTHLIIQDTSTKLPKPLLDLAATHNWTIITRSLETLDDIAHAYDDLYRIFADGLPEPSITNLDQVINPKIPSARFANAFDAIGPATASIGSTLILGSIEPVGAMGPGSYHYQLIESLGLTPAITQGAMWIELDHEDLVTLNPDTILIIAPRSQSESERFESTQPNTKEILKPLEHLELGAITNNRVLIIDHPLGLLPSPALEDIAKEIRSAIHSWASQPDP